MRKPVNMTRGKLATIVISIFLVFVFSITFSIYASNRAVSAAQEAQRTQAIAGMSPVCKWLYATSDVYSELPPTTPTGKLAAEKTEELIKSFQCEKYVPRD